VWVWVWGEDTTILRMCCTFVKRFTARLSYHKTAHTLHWCTFHGVCVPSYGRTNVHTPAHTLHWCTFHLQCVDGMWSVCAVLCHQQLECAPMECVCRLMPSTHCRWHLECAPMECVCRMECAPMEWVCRHIPSTHCRLMVGQKRCKQSVVLVCLSLLSF